MESHKKYQVDFAEIKRVVPLEKILSHYGVLAGLKRAGSQLAGCCPIHYGSNRKQFVVNLEKNSWRCFGDCNRGGGTLELVAEIERVDITEAAVRIARWFRIEAPHTVKTRGKDR
jgi:DNA primase